MAAQAVPAVEMNWSWSWPYGNPLSKYGCLSEREVAFRVAKLSGLAKKYLADDKPVKKGTVIH